MRIIVSSSCWIICVFPIRSDFAPGSAAQKAPQPGTWLEFLSVAVFGGPLSAQDANDWAVWATLGLLVCMVFLLTILVVRSVKKEEAALRAKKFDEMEMETKEGADCKAAAPGASAGGRTSLLEESTRKRQAFIRGGDESPMKFSGPGAVLKSVQKARQRRVAVALFS